MKHVFPIFALLLPSFLGGAQAQTLFEIADASRPPELFAPFRVAPSGETTLIGLSNPWPEETWWRLDLHGLGWLDAFCLRARGNGVATLNLRDALRQFPNAGPVLDPDDDGIQEGYLRIRAIDPLHCRADPEAVEALPRGFFGDYFVVDPPQAFASGGTLARASPADAPRLADTQYEVRLLLGAPFDSMVLEVLAPETDSESRTRLLIQAWDEDGFEIEPRALGGIYLERPLSYLDGADLVDGALAPFGKLRLSLSPPKPWFVRATYKAESQYSVSLDGQAVSATPPPIDTP